MDKIYITNVLESTAVPMLLIYLIKDNEYIVILFITKSYINDIVAIHYLHKHKEIQLEWRGPYKNRKY